MSSSLIVDVCVVKEVKPHKGSDRLSLAIVKGWQVVTGRDQYKAGDVVVFIPPDTLVPGELADKLNIRNYLGGKDKNRVKTVRLRGEMSFGLAIDVPEGKDWEVGYNCASDLNIKKYDPPMRATAGDAAPEDALFTRYTDIENIRNFPDIFKEGERVVATEKADGCFRGDQKIMLPNGEQIPISEVKVEDLVLSYDEESGKFVPGKVEDVIVKSADKEWVHLDFDNDKEIVCTSNHLFLTKNRNWVKAKDLTEEDELVELC